MNSILLLFAICLIGTFLINEFWISRFNLRAFMYASLVETGNKAIIFNDQQWLIQFKVVQRSAIIVEQLDNSLMIETLVFLQESNGTHSDHYARDALRCAVKIGEKVIFLQVAEYLLINSMYSLQHYIWRLKFKLENSSEYLSSELEKNDPVTSLGNKLIIDTSVAVIDYNEYAKKVIEYGAPNVVIVFQRSLFFSKLVPKKKSLANCVHTMRDLNNISIKRLSDWVKIQKEFGFSKLRLYFLNEAEMKHPVIQNLTIDNFVELVAYKTSLAENCDWMLDYLKKDEQNKFWNYSYQMCEDLVDIFFQLNKRFTIHERMNDNDCYLKFRYTYEFVTNYDFDEIILPRDMQINDYSLIKTAQCKDLQGLSNKKYNMYDYARRLVAKYEKQERKKVAAMHFNHFFALPLTNKKNSVDMKMIDNNSAIALLVNKRNVTLLVNTTMPDYSVLSAYASAVELAECVIKNMRVQYFDSIWTSLFLIRIPYRGGKCIFVTDYTETINQHEVNMIAPDTLFVRLPSQDGISSHYRSRGLKHWYVDAYFKFNLSEPNLHFEFEFYSLLMRMGSQINKQSREE